MSPRSTNFRICKSIYQELIRFFKHTHSMIIKRMSVVISLVIDYLTSFLDLEQCTFASLMSISSMAENVVTETKLHSSTTRMFTL